MKSIFLIFILFFNATFGKGQISEYWIYDTTNVVCFYAENLDIPDTVAYLKKKPESGISIIYWDREKKNMYTAVVAGRQDSVITYYRNGQINDAVYYVDKNGNQLSHFLWEAWYPNGKVKGEQIFEGKKRKTICYYQNGQVCRKDESILGGMTELPNEYYYVYMERYCDNGQLIEKDSVNSSSTRQRTIFYCNGKKRFEYISNGANTFGKWQEWYENGQLKLEGQYNEQLDPDLISILDSSKKQGIWKYLDQNGKLLKTENYKDDKIIETKVY